MQRTYQVPFLEHAYLEPDVTMAVPQADGTMMVDGPMQAPFTTRRNRGAVLGMPDQPGPRRQVPMGGGFGGKEDSPIDIGCRAAVLAWHTGRPVRLALEREEITLQTCKRHPMIMEIKLGAKKDGTLTAFEGTIYNEQGAYASLGPVIPPAGGSHIHSMIMMPGPYEIPNVQGGRLSVLHQPSLSAGPCGDLAPPRSISPMNRSWMNWPWNWRWIPWKSGGKTPSSSVRPRPRARCWTRASGFGKPWRPAPGHFDWEKRSRETGYVDPEKTRRRGVGDRHGLVSDQHRHGR